MLDANVAVHVANIPHYERILLQCFAKLDDKCKLSKINQVSEP